jgi:hypothetical protein
MFAVQRMGWKLTRWGWLVVVLAPIISIVMWCSLAEPFFCEFACGG